MTVANESVATLPTSRIWLRGAIAAVVAAALNTIVAALEVSAFSLSPAQLSMQAGPVIALTIVGILAGTGVFVMLRRRGPTGERLFVIIAVIVGALSLLLPVAMMVTPDAFPGGSVRGGAALIPIHLIATSAAIAALTFRVRSTPGQQSS